LRLLEIDQAPIKDEVCRSSASWKNWRKKSKTDGHGAAQSGLAAAQRRTVAASLEAALEDLKAAKLGSATGNQRTARDQFREIARLLLLSQGELEPCARRFTKWTRRLISKKR